MRERDTHRLYERQKSILGAVIDEHFRTARPVASRELVRKRRLGVSPATVRHEMLELDYLGFLEQPHISAGRVPTDRGYRYFVDHLLDAAALNAREERLFRDLFNISDVREFIREFSKATSNITETFVVARSRDEGIFYETGFSKILEAPEFRNSHITQRFGRFIDDSDRAFEAFLEDGMEHVMFIGEESPIAEARLYTMTIARWRHPLGFDGYISMVGPRRAAYRKQKAIIERIKKHD